MADRQIKLGRDLLQCKRPAEIGVQLFAGAVHLPCAKTAAARFDGSSQSAISLGNMRRERKHHMIDEELVGLARAMQRLEQRRAEMTDDPVVMTNPGLIDEPADALDTALFGDVVQRRAR